MTDDAKKGQQSQHGGHRPDVNDALLDIFRQLVGRVGQTPQERPLSPDAAAVLEQFNRYKADFDMLPAIEEAEELVEEAKKNAKQRQTGA